MKKLLLSLGTAIGTLGVTALAAGTVIACAPDPVEEIKTVLTLHVEGYVTIENSSDPGGEIGKITGSYFSRVTLVEAMNEKTASTIAEALGIQPSEVQTAKAKLLEESEDFKDENDQPIYGELEYVGIHTGGTIEGSELVEDKKGDELPRHYLDVKPDGRSYQFGFFKYGENVSPKENDIYWINVEFDGSSKYDLEDQPADQNI